MPDDGRGRAVPVPNNLLDLAPPDNAWFQERSDMDHGEFSRTGVIGNPMTATAGKGEEALERCADHLVKTIDEFRPPEVSVTRRAFEDRV